jgi:hypothetical protein
MVSRGRHRFGIAIRGLAPERVYRVSLWLKAALETRVLMDLRDGPSLHYGTAIFSLPEVAVLRETGDVAASGFRSHDDGWTRVWADMAYAEAPGVIYLALLDAADAPEYFGDGRTGVEFGGIEIIEAQ